MRGTNEERQHQCLENVWSAAGLRGKSLGEETSLRKYIRPLAEMVLLATMSSARACSN